MKKNINQFLVLLTLALFVVACGSDDGNEPSIPTPEQVAPPEAVSLVFPPNNTVCNQGEIISETQSIVTFEYSLAENADTYEVNVTNLNTNITQRLNSNTDELAITIERGTPYEWFVISIAEGTNETATSESALFFNEGPGITNFAPFPAQALNPTRGLSLPNTTITVNLEWEASDTDGIDDIVNYEVFFGANATDLLASLGVVETTTFNNVSVSSNTTFFWQIVTTDSHGNTSTSEFFTFQVL